MKCNIQDYLQAIRTTCTLLYIYIYIVFIKPGTCQLAWLGRWRNRALTAWRTSHGTSPHTPVATEDWLLRGTPTCTQSEQIQLPSPFTNNRSPSPCQQRRGVRVKRTCCQKGNSVYKMKTEGGTGPALQTETCPRSLCVSVYKPECVCPQGTCVQEALEAHGWGPKTHELCRGTLRGRASGLIPILRLGDPNPEQRTCRGGMSGSQASRGPERIDFAQ